MLSRNDPRVRRAIDQLTQNFEAANERTQEGIYSFTQSYLHPCFTSVADCVHSCTTPCFPRDEDQRRRHRGRTRSRSRAEFSFDFYDDWEETETDALLGLGDDEGDSGQLRRERQMDYGIRQGGHILPKGFEEDGTKHIPSSSYFGFLAKLPFKIGTKGLKYQPSIADLQDHPGSRCMVNEEEEPLLPDSDSEAERSPKKQKRRLRSGTQGSGHTTDSFSSRGDIFPSDDEMDDAVPLDDEFALALERRTTGHATNDCGSGKARAFETRSSSHLSIQTISSGGSTKHANRKPAIVENYSSTKPPDLNLSSQPENAEMIQQTIISPQNLYSQQMMAHNTVTSPTLEVNNIRPTKPATSPASFQNPSSRLVDGFQKPQPLASPVSSMPTASPNCSPDLLFNAAALPRFASS
jgi:hypothetical protein